MYFDGTEHTLKGFSPPTSCPLCRGKLATRWTPAIQCRRGRGYFAIAVPAHTCVRCQIAVRVCVLPRALFKTRKGERERARRASSRSATRGSRGRARGARSDDEAEA